MNFKLFSPHSSLFFCLSRKSDGSMKLTGNPALAEKISRNRKAYFLKNKINPAKVVSAEIVHGGKVSLVNEKDGDEIISGADGLITQNKGIYLTMTG
jgi:copper oxidase (laccase) domain-containing protein